MILKRLQKEVYNPDVAMSSRFPQTLTVIDFNLLKFKNKYLYKIKVIKMKFFSGVRDGCGRLGWVVRFPASPPHSRRPCLARNNHLTPIHRAEVSKKSTRPTLPPQPRWIFSKPHSVCCLSRSATRAGPGRRAPSPSGAPVFTRCLHHRGRSRGVGFTPYTQNIDHRKKFCHSHQSKLGLRGARMLVARRLVLS